MPTVDELLGPPKVDDLLGPPPVWTPDAIIKHAGPGAPTSTGRTPAQNRRVGGSPTSSHLTAQAIDWRPADGDTATAARKLAAAGLPYDQIIDEKDHVHIGYGPKNRNQVIGVKPTVDDFLGPPRVDDLLGPTPAPVAAAKPTLKPLPRRAVVVPPSLMDKVAAPFKDFGASFSRRAKAGRESFMEGARQFAPGDGQAADPINAGLGLLKQAGGVWEAWPGAVAGAVGDVVLGRPLEAATGGRVKASTAGDALDMASGFLVPGPKGVKGASGAEYQAFKPTAVERAAGSTVRRAGKKTAPLVDDILGPETVAPVAEVAPVVKPPPLTKEAAALVERPKAVAAATEDPYDDIIFAPARARKGGTLSLPKPPAASDPKGVVEGLSDAASAVQKILAPATVGKAYPAAATIRRASAESDLLAAQSAHRLVEHAAKVSTLPVEQQRALIGYIENRSLGAKLPDPELQKVADDIRDVNETYRSRIEQVMGLDEGPSFIRDYYTHMWKEAPQVVEGRMAIGRQGSGRNLKARSIPTLQDGIDAGLTPLTENPIEATTLYAQNMSRYLATVDTQADLTAKQLAKFYPVGTAPEGWVPLNGIRTEKPGRVIVQDGETVAAPQAQKLYAPADVARVYNNWISNGMDRGDGAALFNPWRKASNGLVQLKLGLSPFHAMTMVQEATINELARGVTALSKTPGLALKGQFGEVGKELGNAAKAVARTPAQLATFGAPYAMRGNRMQKELLGDAAPDGMSKVVNDAFIRSGGRVKMDNLYRTRGAGSFYNAIGDGTWKRELADTAEKIFGKDKLLSHRAKGIIDLGANLIQSTAAPLFEWYIPRLKQGAFAANMEDWLRANPNAPQKAIDEQAFLLNRSIDNRFGEMAWDNLFWHRNLKQASQLLLLSPTWNMGTINEIGGGLLDLAGPSAKGLATGKGVTPRTAYIAAGIAQVALVNAIMTYLKTGERPEGRDFMAYRTGGTDVGSGEPERAMTPGYQKDIYSFLYEFPTHIGEEAKDKLNPALKMALETNANEDYRGLPIWNRDAPVDEKLKQYGDYALESFMPISIGQLAKGGKVGSGLSPLERGLAIRPAPSYIQAPERLKSIKEGKRADAWKRKWKADAKAENQLEKNQGK